MDLKVNARQELYVTFPSSVFGSFSSVCIGYFKSSSGLKCGGICLSIFQARMSGQGVFEWVVTEYSNAYKIG